MPNRRSLTALPLVMLLLAACSVSPGGNDASSSGEARTVEVRMSDELRFEPEEIAVTAGETVRFEVVNEGQAVHEFLIGDEAAQAEFEEEMAGGAMDHEGEAGVSVEAGQTGTFEYTFEGPSRELLAGCHEPGHYAGGMVAIISVTD